MSTDLKQALHDLADSTPHAPLQPEQLMALHSRRERRRRAFVAGVVGAATLGAIGLVAVPGLGEHPDTLTTSPATSLASGRDWLIDEPVPRHSNGVPYDPEDEDPIGTPSDPPRVEEPYPIAAARLRERIDAAQLPPGAQVELTDAEFGLATAQITLPDGTELLVQRDRYDHPIKFRMSSADGIGAHITVEDVPGTRSAALIDPASSYRLPTEPGPASQGIVIVDADGTTTFWIAPSTFNRSELRKWAFASAHVARS